MKKKLIPVIALLASCFNFTGLSVQAGYESPEQVVVNMKAMNGGFIKENEPHQVYISPEEAENGAVVHVGIWFETDISITDISTVTMNLSCETIAFVPDSYQSPSTYAYAEAQEFTHTDGKVYSTRFKPYCFGRINMMDKYEHGSSFCMGNMQENEFTLEWGYDYNRLDENGDKILSAAFFGDASDSYSFVEFDVQIPAGTPAGTYPIQFTKLDVSSDDSIPDEENPGKFISYYSHITPVSYPVEIVVTEHQPQLTEEIQPVFRFAEDTKAFSLEDFAPELDFTYAEENFHSSTADLVEVFETGSPSELSMEGETVRKLQSTLNWNGNSLENPNQETAALEYYIGRKGDANQDGVVNAEDAALILTYAANVGVGQKGSITGKDGTDEEFSLFLSDVNEDGAEAPNLNAVDAAYILTYAAQVGSGHQPDWNEIITS